MVWMVGWAQWADTLYYRIQAVQGLRFEGAVCVWELLLMSGRVKANDRVVGIFAELMPGVDINPRHVIGSTGGHCDLLCKHAG